MAFAFGIISKLLYAVRNDGHGAFCDSDIMLLCGVRHSVHSGLYDNIEQLLQDRQPQGIILNTNKIQKKSAPRSNISKNCRLDFS